MAKPCSSAWRMRSGRGVTAGRSAGEDRQDVAEGVGGVEERLLVLLVVLVVRQRLALHHREQRHQRAVDAAGLAAHELGHVRVLLLRHDRGAGGEAVGDVDEAEARAHPDHQLLGQARDVGHGERRRGEEFDREVAVGHRVERVLAHAVEAELARHRLAVDRKAGAGQRRGAQRQAVDPLAAVGEALGVAAEHLEVRHQVVAEGHRLRDLHMGEARHQDVGVLRRPGRAAPRARRAAAP